MKISKLCGTLIIAFSLLTNTIFLFSQESAATSEDSKCPALSVTPSNQNVTSSSGTTSFTVTSNVSWTSSSNQEWCTVTLSGTGNGIITATYQSNTGTGSRVAAIRVTASGVADQVVTVTQVGSAPALIITPTNRDVNSSAGTTSFGIASNTTWTATSDQSWCTVTSSGNGNGTINVTYQANSGTNTRIASITITGSGVNDQVVTVTQLGTAPALIVTPLSQNVGSAAGAISFAVTSNIAWTSSTPQSWSNSTPSGTGNGTIVVTYYENTGAASRIATVKVSGPGVSDQTVTVTQAGILPSLMVTPSNQDVTSAAGETSFTVVSNVSWTSTSDQPWCTVTPSGTGDGTIMATYQAHTSVGTRTATITVTGSGAGTRTVTVTQAGVTPSLIVTPPNQNVTSPSGSVTFQVASNIDWTSTSDQAWCIVTSSGSGNGTITATYEANSTPLERVATITISGPGVSDQHVTVTQDELITISYSGFPWCPSGGPQDVTLSGTPGGTYSSLPEGLDINPSTGEITTATSPGGSYTVKYTLEKSSGHIIEATTQVSVYETVTPEIAVKWNDVLICPNLENLNMGYQWYSGSTPISGATKQFYLTSKVPGSYTVEVLDGHGCKTMSEPKIMDGTKSLVVYPNPATTSFKIGISDVPAGRVQIKINDMAGIVVLNLYTDKSDFEYVKEISTENLNNGMYFVQVLVNDLYFYSEKLMVAK